MTTETDAATFACPSCGQPLVLPDGFAGGELQCPGCSEQFKVAVDPPAAVASVVPQVPAPEGAPVAPSVKVSHSGWGCLVQCLALFLGLTAFVLLMIPGPSGAVMGASIGVLGLGLLIKGALMSVSYECGKCRNKLGSSRVRLCPACGCEIVDARTWRKINKPPQAGQ